MTSLFESTHCRATDPSTSRLGARAGRVKAGTNKAVILDFLRRFHDQTKDDAASFTGLDEHEVGRRLSDLHAEGLIVPSRVRGRSRTWRVAVSS